MKNQPQPNPRKTTMFILHNVTNNAYLSVNRNGIGPLFVRVKAEKNEELLTYADKDAAYGFTKLSTAKFFVSDLAAINPIKHYVMLDTSSNLPVFEIENGVRYYFQDGVKLV